MGRYDDAWADAVPRSAWPACLLEAVRDDPSALATRRAITSLRAWRAEAAAGDATAGGWLERVARALTHLPAARAAPSSTDPDGDETDPRTPSVLGPPAPPPPPREPSVAGEDDLTVPRRRSAVGASSVSEGTQVIRDAAILESRDLEPPDGSAEPASENAVSALGAAETSGFDAVEAPTAALASPDASEGAPAEANAAPRGGERPPHQVALRAPLDDPPSDRPPAAAAQVQALARVLTPLAEEIVPLPQQRRERRFWARWREVAGDRGVRREVVAQLLEDIGSRDELLTGLIAEVQGVDPRSVAEHLADLDPEACEAPPPLTPERGRGPLIGASVRVEGVLPEE